MPDVAVVLFLQVVANRHAELNEKKKKEYESLPYDEQQKIDARNDKRANRKRFNRKVKSF